jgi:hypothetical protein
MGFLMNEVVMEHISLRVSLVLPASHTPLALIYQAGSASLHLQSLSLGASSLIQQMPVHRVLSRLSFYESDVI